MASSASRNILAAIIIAVILAAAALPFAVPSVRQGLLSLTGPRRGELTLVALDSPGDLMPNASFSVWAWMPTPNGTEFIPVLNGTGGVVSVNLSRLRGWAEAWLHSYGNAAAYSLEPSIIIWASYPINLGNGSVEVVTQLTPQPLNLSEVLDGSGSIIYVRFSRPFTSIIAKSVVNGKGLSAVGSRPQQTTTTSTSTAPVTTSTQPIVCAPHAGYPCFTYVYAPKVIAWYPSNDSLAPISLAVAAAQPNGNLSAVKGAEYIGIADADYSVSEFSINVVTVAGSAFEAAFDSAKLGDWYEAVKDLSPEIPGASLTFVTDYKVQEGGGTAATTNPTQDDDVGQIYMVGQGALVNWTEYRVELATPSGPILNETPVGWYLSYQVTEVKVVSSGSAYVPALYGWVAYDSCINVSRWAYEQQVLEQSPSTFFGSNMNRTCPLPNTPAPVIWQDYASNLSLMANIAPSSSTYTFTYVELSVGSSPSTLGIGIDLGSALASAAIFAVATALGQPGLAFALTPVVAGVISSISYESSGVAASANIMTLINTGSTTINVYYSNMTPVYTITSSGVELTLPRELIYINATAEAPSA